VTPTAEPAERTGSSPAVELDGVCLRFGAVEALHDVTLSVPRGTSVAVIGPNGSGKSTLLGVISGLLVPQEGRVRVLGQPVPRAREHVAHVLQSTQVRAEVPLTVREAVRMGTYATLGLVGRGGAASRARVERALERLGIAGLAERQLPELSGGQRQRVFVAQGLVQGADLLLLDEPVAGLDPPTQEVIARVIRDERAAGRTVITTTHDVGAAATNDLVLLLSTEVVAFGPPSEVLVPELLSRGFGGHLHVLEDGTMVLDDPAHHGAVVGQRTQADWHADAEADHTDATPAEGVRAD
jgi:ABC-type Mn2+/Zn2+ transport system ATPase subunit